MSTEREKDDVIEFHNTSITNKMFSVLLKKKLACPRGHKDEEYATSLGLNIKITKKKQSLKKLLRSFFDEKLTTSLCKKCRHIHRDNGKERFSIVDFPRYLVVFADHLDEKTGGFRRPLTRYGTHIDLTKFKEETMKSLGKKFSYSLTAILSHEKTSSIDDSMYTAVVKRRVDGQDKKCWFTFNKEEVGEISEEEALTYPA